MSVHMMDIYISSCVDSKTSAPAPALALPSPCPRPSALRAI